MFTFITPDFILYGFQVPSHFDSSGMLRQTGKGLVRTRSEIPHCSVPIATSTAIHKGEGGEDVQGGEEGEGGEEGVVGGERNGLNEGSEKGLKTDIKTQSVGF